jgi:hypothetical protein
MRELKMKLKIGFLTQIMCACFFLSFQTNENGDFIEWSDKIPLKWDDFKGQPDPTSEAVAMEYDEILFDYFTNGDTCYLTIKTLFHKKDSWVKKNKVTTTDIKHEQTHFDITEYCARVSRCLVKNFTFTKNDYRLQIKVVEQLIARKCEFYQDVYDLQTFHSINKKQQEYWNEEIRKLLDEFRYHRGTVVKIVLK